MVSVFNFDIYTIPEKFIEKSYLLSLIDNEEEVYVDDFISSFINKNLSDMQEEELEDFIKIISKFASFYSRLRVESNKLLGLLILERMMDEADKEADHDNSSDNNFRFRSIDGEENNELFEKLKRIYEEE